MIPSSEELESLFNRAKQLSTSLRRLRGAEVTNATLKADLAALAREWLRISPSLKESSVCAHEKLASFDSAMQEILASNTTRARASALSRKLALFVNGAFQDIVVPVIQFEGSPKQVAARQIVQTLSGSVSIDESAYVEEAARCVTVQAYRAAIIMLWAAGVARVHAAVVQRGFDAFNKALDVTIGRKGAPFNRVNAGSRITSLPELQRARDGDLILVGMELFSYDLQVYQELDRLLGARNDSAHPGSAQPNALDVQQFAAKLGALLFDRITI